MCSQVCTFVKTQQVVHLAFFLFILFICYLKGGRGRSRSGRKKERERKNCKKMNLSYDTHAGVYKVKDTLNVYKNMMDL